LKTASVAKAARVGFGSNPRAIAFGVNTCIGSDKLIK
jgi:hypothetical protein